MSEEPLFDVTVTLPLFEGRVSVLLTGIDVLPQTTITPPSSGNALIAASKVAYAPCVAPVPSTYKVSAATAEMPRAHPHSTQRTIVRISRFKAFFIIRPPISANTIITHTNIKYIILFFSLKIYKLFIIFTKNKKFLLYFLIQH